MDPYDPDDLLERDLTPGADDEPEPDEEEGEPWDPLDIEWWARR